MAPPVAAYSADNTPALSAAPRTFNFTVDDTIAEGIEAVAQTPSQPAAAVAGWGKFKGSEVEVKRSTGEWSLATIVEVKSEDGTVVAQLADNKLEDRPQFGISVICGIKEVHPSNFAEFLRAPRSGT